MSITRKITLGYIILIFIPMLAFGYHYYTQIYGGLIQQFVESRQKILEQAYANMKMDLTRVQSIHRAMQYNAYVTDYLDGVFHTELASVYSFIRYIRPLYGEALFAYPEIDSLLIYKKNDHVFSIYEHFVDWSMLDPQIESKTRSLKPGVGIWLRVNSDTTHPELVYYQHLYNTQFTEIIGLLEITINDSLIDKFYESAGVKEPWQAFFLDGDQFIGDVPKELPLDQLQQQLQSEQHTSFFYRKHVINQLHIEELDVRFVVTGKVGEVFHSLSRADIILILFMLLFLVGLSLIFYGLASSITKRVLRLARHMRKLNDDSLRQNLVKHDNKEKDEISFLIETYNTMILRMDELINNVHRAEILNKEAAYKVLQAQIKPHFLYNTLETIRMLAETNNDQEVADISFRFGKLMRYSLSSEQDEITLSQEIEMAVYYLQIHKTRLQTRLSYELEVSVDTNKIICPRFILQPLVENSVNHGVSAVIRPVHIRLAAEELEHEFKISVIDNGKGISEEKLFTLKSLLSSSEKLRDSSLTIGVGLLNVNERVKTFFGGTSRLEVASVEGKETSVSIFIDKRRVIDIETINS